MELAVPVRLAVSILWICRCFIAPLSFAKKAAPWATHALRGMRVPRLVQEGLQDETFINSIRISTIGGYSYRSSRFPLIVTGAQCQGKDQAAAPACKVVANYQTTSVVEKEPGCCESMQKPFNMSVSAHAYWQRLLLYTQELLCHQIPVKTSNGSKRTLRVLTSLFCASARARCWRRRMIQ